MVLKAGIGQTVNVTLRSTMPLRINGTLKEFDEIAICFDQGAGKPDLFVPLTSVLHIEPVQK